ncbi:MAG: hypothetical protein V1913_04615 [Fibrobacterota bacterium]
MPFVKITGTPGLVFVPEKEWDEEKKHPCPDCDSCQWCADERCRLCRKRSHCSGCQKKGRKN